VGTGSVSHSPLSGPCGTLCICAPSSHSLCDGKWLPSATGDENTGTPLEQSMTAFTRCQMKTQVRMQIPEKENSVTAGARPRTPQRHVHTL